jgi:hypothetical protein
VAVGCSGGAGFSNDQWRLEEMLRWMAAVGVGVCDALTPYAQPVTAGTTWCRRSRRSSGSRRARGSGLVHRVRDAPAPATASRRCADRNRCWYALGDTPSRATNARRNILGAPVADPLGGLGDRIARLQRCFGAVEAHRLDVLGGGRAELLVEQAGEVARAHRGQRRELGDGVVAGRIRGYGVEHRAQRRCPRAGAA